MPRVVGAHIDGIASNHGTTKRFVSQLDTPDDVSTGGRIPVNRRIARWTTVVSSGERDGRRGHIVTRMGSPGLTPAIRLNAHSASSRKRGIVCCRAQRLSGRLRLRSDASQGSGREDTHRGIHPSERR